MTDDPRVREALDRAVETVDALHSFYSVTSDQERWLAGWLKAIRILLSHGHGQSNWHDVGDDGCEAITEFCDAVLGERDG